MLSLYLHCAGQSFFSTVSGSGITETALEVGTVFTTSQIGKVTALKFYKWKNDAWLYTLKLYANGYVAASTTYTSTATGWITVPITPVQIFPTITYIVSYYSPSGYYQAVNTYAFPITIGSLKATKSVYKYGTLSSTVPTSTFQTSAYFADVVFAQDPLVAVIHDTIHEPVLCPDTTWVYVDGWDTATTNAFPDYRDYGIFEFTLLGNKHVRFFRAVQLVWRRQEQQADGTWKDQ